MTEMITIDEKNLLDDKDPDINNTKSTTPSGYSFKGDRAEEKELLKGMGFEEDLINAIYNNMNPIDIQEALDFLNKNEKGKFTHSFLINEKNVCTICGKGRSEHESDTLFVEDNDNLSLDDEDEKNDFLDDLLGNRNSNSNRFRAYEDSYRKSLGKDKKNDEEYNKFNTEIECGICGEVIISPIKVQLKCKHYFCKDCWIDYLTEKITNANVSKIFCMQHGCDQILETKFIKNILEGNKDLIDKYDKFYQRKKMLEQSDKIKLCPIPDCEGYAEKKGKSKYVKCNFGHEFCFECGSAPHGKKKCEDMMDKEFEEWRSHKIVKRCPCCRMWTEKNEGCNHMTCVECKFQWCWLCQKPYSSNHFYEGSCNGLQFYKETDEKIIKEKLEHNRKIYGEPGKYYKYFCNFWKCVGYIFLVFYLKMFQKYERKLMDMECFVEVIFYMAYLPIFINFEIFFIIATIIGTIPLLIYPPFFRRLKFFIAYRLFQF
jgi:hypothetical protein